MFGVWYTNCLQICDKNAGFDLEQAEIVSNYICTYCSTNIPLAQVVDARQARLFPCSPSGCGVTECSTLLGA